LCLTPTRARPRARQSVSLWRAGEAGAPAPMSGAPLGASRRSKPSRVLYVMRVGAIVGALALASVFAAVHSTGGGLGSTAGSLVTSRVPTTTPAMPPVTDSRRDTSRQVTTPKVIRSVNTDVPKDGRETAEMTSTLLTSTAEMTSTTLTSTPPPVVVTPNQSNANASSTASQVYGKSEETVSYDDTKPAKEVAARFLKQCAEVDLFFQETGKRYAPDSLNDANGGGNNNSNSVIIMDWSENFFNGIGDEMQHYQELLAVGLGTGRASYLHTQKVGCDGTGMAGSSDSPTLTDLAKNCRFDLGDYFTGMHGVDWVWNEAKAEKVRKELGADALGKDMLVVTWSQNGMYYSRGHDSFTKGETEPPNGTYVAPPDANFVEVMLGDYIFQSAKVVRVRVKQSFGHWCHPHQPGDWGMCASYRWVVGIENPQSDGVEPIFEHGPPSKPLCPGCSVGGCFGAAAVHPRESLKQNVAPFLSTMQKRGWTKTVAAHVRVGFADISELAPPTDVRRAQNATLATIDEFLAQEAKRVPYPEPVCSLGKSDSFSSNSSSAPLTGFLRCVAATGANVSGGETWGMFLMTDSPVIRSVVMANAVALGIENTLATSGAYGHVKATNTAVCVDDDADDGDVVVKNADPRYTNKCDASDPRGAWERSMVDLVLMGFAEVEVMLFQSKFGSAANFIADIPRGLREYYPDTRLTHSLLIPLLGEMKGDGYDSASDARKQVWGAVWDLFGPAGEREDLKTSEFAVQ
jgi:hypothetical protein